MRKIFEAVVSLFISEINANTSIFLHLPQLTLGIHSFNSKLLL